MAEGITELYQPDQLPDLIEDPGFTALKFEDRKKVFEQGVEESASWMRQNGGWSPESFTDFRQSVRALRGKVEGGESFGEEVMGGLRTIGGVLKDSAAVIGTTVADLRFADAQDGEVKLRAPLSDVGPALDRNMEKLTDSVRTAQGKSRGSADEAVDAQLDALDAAIDGGEFLKGDPKAWLKSQADAMEKPIRSYYEQQRTAPESVEDYLKGNRLDSSANLPLVMRYLATANPSARKQLRENLLRLPDRAALEKRDEAATTGSDTGKFLDDVFGAGSSRYVSEAGDPLEVFGNVTAFLGGKALVSGVKAAMKTGAKGLAAGGLKIAAGTAGETLSEMGSLFMDDPNATAGDYAKVAKDAAIGSLGLAGLGGAYQVARDRLAPVEGAAEMPAAAVPTPVTQPAGPTMVPDGTAAVRPPAVPTGGLAPAAGATITAPTEGASDADFAGAEASVLSVMAGAPGGGRMPSGGAAVPETTLTAPAEGPAIAGSPGSGLVLESGPGALGVDTTGSEAVQGDAPAGSANPEQAPGGGRTAWTPTGETERAEARTTNSEGPVKFRDFDGRGRLSQETEMSRPEALKRLRGRESVLRKVLDCMGRGST